MRQIASWILVLWILQGCSGTDSDEAPEAQCARVRDHLIDLRLADATGIEPAAHREALRAALGEDFVARCTSSMTDQQVSCALNAVDTFTLNACPGGH